MTQRVSLKLLILFGIVCTTFVLAESKLYADDAIANKSSTFSTQLSNRDDDGNDSELAEKIRAQRAAIDARDTRDAVSSQNKSGAKQNNCDNDLRKCISTQCGANYKKCETDSDTTFSDKLTACRKNTTCTAHEFTLFTNEIKQDKKQAIDLAMYNAVIDCGNSYNDCIIKQCGTRFNKCLSKSAGDNAIAACKQIAQNCTEADSGLVGRIGNVFGIVRQDAEKQIKADEVKLQSLRDKMRSSCRTLGAMFDDRTLDCVFNVSFYAGDDKTHPMASKKLYAGSMFDCTPDWFGIDITTFKENAYRATRAQTAASSAMLGSGVGTAVGAITSGAIDRAIKTKQAKDELSDECEKAGKKVKDGKCVDMTEEDKCKADGGKWKGGKCVDKSNNKKDKSNPTQPKDPENKDKDDAPAPAADAPASNDNGNNNNNDNNNNNNANVNTDNDEALAPEQDLCDPADLRKLNAKAGLKDASGTCIPSLCLDGNPPTDGKCAKVTIEKLPAATPVDVPPKIEPIDQHAVARDACTDSGGDWNAKKNTCSCAKKKGLTDGIKGFSCQCQTNGYTYDAQAKKCVKPSTTPAKDATTPAPANNSKTPTWQEVSEFAAPAQLMSSRICTDNQKIPVTSNDAVCDFDTKKCAYPCYDRTDSPTSVPYFVVCCDMSGTTPTCKKTDTTGVNAANRYYNPPTDLAVNTVCK